MIKEEKMTYNKKKLDHFKIVISTVGLCLLSILIMHLYADKVPEIIEKVNEKGSMANVIWVIERITIVAPVIFLAVALSIFYCNKEKYLPVNTQKEKFYISLFTALFVYGVMLPYVYFSSKGMAEALAEEGLETLWQLTYKWFFVQIIPFMIMISYHAIRADSEERELSAAEGEA
jgi:succinate dehydrogenase/fumarate reductase cytochrome b subunit